jgi:predicted nucleic acid-binding protein
VTPLISLLGVRLLDLLPQRYGEVWIATQVLVEYQTGADPADPDLATLPWISIHPITTFPSFSRRLDDGEAATIALALALNARVVLIDEKRARSEAARLGLQVAGTLDILLWAKQYGVITDVGPIVDGMVAQGRHISPKLRDAVLKKAGESP